MTWDTLAVWFAKTKQQAWRKCEEPACASCMRGCVSQDKAVTPRRVAFLFNQGFRDVQGFRSNQQSCVVMPRVWQPFLPRPGKTPIPGALLTHTPPDSHLKHRHRAVQTKGCVLPFAPAQMHPRPRPLMAFCAPGSDPSPTAVAGAASVQFVSCSYRIQVGGIMTGNLKYMTFC